MVLLPEQIRFRLATAIGGLNSHVDIPANPLNNVFPNVPEQKAVEGVLAECYCIFIENTSEVDAALKITAWISSNSSSNQNRIEFGIGASGVNASEITLPTAFMLPPNVEFIDVSAKPSEPQILSLKPGQSIPIWFNRKTIPHAVSEANVHFTFSIEVERAVTQDVGAPIQCPAGTVLDPSTGQCVVPIVCPEGSTYNPITRECEPDEDDPNPDPTCPEGQHYNPVTQQCEDDIVNPPPTGEIPTRVFAAVGDFDCNSRTDDTFGTLIDGLQITVSTERPLGMLLGLGDFSYGSNQDCFITRARTLQALFPTWIKCIIGNHDDTEDGSASKRSQIINTFGMPSEGYYSFTLDNIRFIMMDTQKPLGSGSGQHTFVQAQLQAAQTDPNILWIIVCYHKPSVVGQNNDHGGLTSVQNAYHQMFDTYGVDFVLAGHNHNSEITYMVNHSQSVGEPTLVSQGTVVQNVRVYQNVTGRIFMTLGGGGRTADSIDVSDSWSSFATSQYAVGFFSLLSNGRILRFNLVRSSDQSILYTLEVRK